MSDALKDKVILVTGGARGLGAAICSAVVREGATAIVADLNEASARDTARMLTDGGGRAEAAALDVGDEEQVQRVLGTLHERHRRIDAVINNAGVDVTLPIGELPSADWERVLRTNLHGPFLMARHALPFLLSSRGHLVNITSTAARRAWPNASAYHASKYGLLGLSHALHAELRAQGVKVTAVIAGGMRTPFLLQRFPDIGIETLQEPADVARAVAFVLTSPPDSVIAEIMVLPMRETSWP
jgi:NAD(P)-dependent dehydrogenase (short-subunit alcohol dehydrogenase family)